jgi:hypothetical protein
VRWRCVCLCVRALQGMGVASLRPLQLSVILCCTRCGTSHHAAVSEERQHEGECAKVSTHNMLTRPVHVRDTTLEGFHTQPSWYNGT